MKNGAIHESPFQFTESLSHVLITHTLPPISLSLSLLNLCNLPLDELVYLSHLGRGDSKSIFIHPSVLGDIFISSLIVFFSNIVDTEKTRDVGSSDNDHRVEKKGCSRKIPLHLYFLRYNVQMILFWLLM